MSDLPEITNTPRMLVVGIRTNFCPHYPEGLREPMSCIECDVARENAPKAIVTSIGKTLVVNVE